MTYYRSPPLGPKAWAAIAGVMLFGAGIVVGGHNAPDPKPAGSAGSFSSLAAQESPSTVTRTIDAPKPRIVEAPKLAAKPAPRTVTRTVEPVETVAVAPSSKPKLKPAEKTGAVCRDGWQSSSTGSGTCSGHGGVEKWL